MLNPFLIEREFFRGGIHFPKDVVFKKTASDGIQRPAHAEESLLQNCLRQELRQHHHYQRLRKGSQSLRSLVRPRETKVETQYPGR